MAKPCAVGDRIFRNFSFLRNLAKTRSLKKRVEMIDKATKEQLLAIVEIVSNVVKYKTFCLDKRQAKKIKPYEKYLRKLSNVKTQRQAQALLQKGGGLGILPSLLIPVLVEVARSLFS